MFLAGALLTTGCDIQPNDNTLPGQVAIGDDGYTIEVHFGQIENLVPNSTVQKDNVVIGTVGEIETKDWKGVVELHLLEEVELPAGAIFSIGQKTLLGAQYVEVSDPKHTGGARLVDGDVVGIDQTGTYPATEQVLGAVALLLNNGGLSQISTITGEISTALRDRVPDTRGLIRRTNDLLAVLDANKSDIVAALESLERLSSGLREDEARIAKAIDQITPGLRVLNQERARLVRAVTTTGRAGVRAARLVEASRTALLANLESLGPILTNLGKVSTDIPEALKMGLTIPFPLMTTRDAVRGDYANLFATIDLRSSSLIDSWLGGLPLPLQAGDPVQDPLDVPAPGGDAPQRGNRSGETEREAGQPRRNSGLGGLLTPDPEESKSDCLLRLLGLC